MIFQIYIYNSVHKEASYREFPNLPGHGLFVFTTRHIQIYSKEDYLAWVVSHEIAHALREHHAQTRQAKRSGVDKLEYEKLLQQQEFEADELGSILTARAGYNPATGIRFFRMRLSLDSEKKTRPAGENTHPPVRVSLVFGLLHIKYTNVYLGSSTNGKIA